MTETKAASGCLESHRGLSCTYRTVLKKDSNWKFELVYTVMRDAIKDLNPKDNLEILITFNRASGQVAVYHDGEHIFFHQLQELMKQSNRPRDSEYSELRSRTIKSAKEIQELDASYFDVAPVTKVDQMLAYGMKKQKKYVGCYPEEEAWNARVAALLDVRAKFPAAVTAAVIHTTQ